jgi:putative SOS response-associated peptidase YedK
MCGRYVLAAASATVAAHFCYRDAEWFPPRYNIAPTQPIAVVRFVRRAREFALVRWGLIPGWAKDPSSLNLLINARAEGIAQKSGFRGALQYRRCLIPATGYYQWRRQSAGPLQPWLVRRKDGGPMAFAGLWEAWMGKDGSEIDTACIITTAANPVLAQLGDRMPVVVEADGYEAWLDTDRYSVASAQALLRPAREELLAAVPVSHRVNSAGNDDPGLLEPLAGAAT